MGMGPFCNFYLSHMFVSILAACSNCQGTISLAFALYFINEPLFEFIQLIQTQFKKWLQPTRLRLLFECRRLAFRRTRWPRKALLRATTYLSPLFLSKMKDADLDLQDKGRVKFKCWSWVQSCASGMLLFKSFHSLITTVPSAIFNFFCQIFCEVIGALKLVSLSHISTRKAVILLLLVFLLNCTVATAMDAETSQSSGGANTVQVDSTLSSSQSIFDPPNGPSYADVHVCQSDEICTITRTLSIQFVPARVRIPVTLGVQRQKEPRRELYPRTWM